MRAKLDLAFVAVFAVVAQGCADVDDHASVDALQIELTLRESISSHEAVIADVTITNAGHAPVQLLSWYLPADELQESLFTVTRDGAPVRYTGPIYKRAKPDADDFVTLAPGAMLSRRVDLSKFYDVSKTGGYTVEVAIDDAKLRGQPGLVASAPAAAWIEGRTRAPEKPVRDTCSIEQKSLIANALVVAGQYADSAADYLAGPASATPRYTTWFGTFSASNWNQVSDNFTAIANAFATQPITVDCSCKQKNVYAYVNPSQPYKIFVCGAFWTAPTSGTDSKAGTFVHEMSHFDIVAGTDDWAYGKSACMTLAQSDPAKAIANADSHEYFAENTPAQ